jgi:DNA-binding NtrC family response regulator
MKTTSLLIVDDDEAFRTALGGELERQRFAVALAGSGEDALRRLAEREPDVVLLDLQMPGLGGIETLKIIRERHSAIDVIVLTGHGSIDTAIESIRMGAFDYVPKPCPLDELEVRIHRAVEQQELRRRATLLERGLTPPDLRDAFVGESEPFRQVLALIDRVAPTDSAVLITGETGSGKEMVAKLIHARSTRRQRPFVVVECAALQESLLQSELFGHERGAFTGADRSKPGLFEVAHGGTIFLDEIGEVSLATQVKLLRVLDTSTFRRVGATSEIKVNVRVLAATNRDLEASVRQGRFREDLFYRLSTIRLSLPPLRDRGGDVDLLADHFIARTNERLGTRRRLGPSARKLLEQHDWPGNVRELFHAIEAAVIVCDGAEILPEHLPAALRSSHPQERRAEAAPIATLEAMERAHIELALRAMAGHRGQAARLLGISERNLYRKLREYELDQ